MLFLHILVALCTILIFGLLVISIKFDVDNEFVTLCSPMGFLTAIIYGCLYLVEKRKHPSEKKLVKGFMMAHVYFTLVVSIILICGSLIVAGLAGSFLPLITGATYFFAAAAIFFYIEENRKGAPLDKSEEQSSEIHG